jgi:hypothetical protein
MAVKTMMAVNSMARLRNAVVSDVCGANRATRRAEAGRRSGEPGAHRDDAIVRRARLR